MNLEELEKHLQEVSDYIDKVKDNINEAERSKDFELLKNIKRQIRDMEKTFELDCVIPISLLIRFDPACYDMFSFRTIESFESKDSGQLTYDAVNEILKTNEKFQNIKKTMLDLYRQKKAITKRIEENTSSKERDLLDILYSDRLPKLHSYIEQYKGTNFLTFDNYTKLSLRQLNGYKKWISDHILFGRSSKDMKSYIV